MRMGKMASCLETCIPLAGRMGGRTAGRVCSRFNAIPASHRIPHPPRSLDETRRIRALRRAAQAQTQRRRLRGGARHMPPRLRNKTAFPPPPYNTSTYCRLEGPRVCGRHPDASHAYQRASFPLAAGAAGEQERSGTREGKGKRKKKTVFSCRGRGGHVLLSRACVRPVGRVGIIASWI